jgi:hypothetical protein
MTWHQPIFEYETIMGEQNKQHAQLQVYLKTDTATLQTTQTIMHLEYTSECLLQSRTDQETTTKANQI